MNLSILHYIILLSLTVEGSLAMLNLKLSNCYLDNVKMTLAVGNKTKSLTTSEIAALQLEISHSNIMHSVVLIRTYTSYSFVSVHINDCSLNGKLLYKDKQGGSVGVLVENTRGERHGVFSFYDVAYVKVKNCRFGLHTMRCVYGCGIFVKGIELFAEEWSHLERLADILASPISGTCNFKSSHLIVEETDFLGDIFSSGSVIYSQDINLKIFNCNFLLKTVPKEGGFIYFSAWKKMSIKLIDVTFDGSKINTSTKIMTITAHNMESQNTKIICSKSMQPMETVQDHLRLYSCNYICPIESYSFSSRTITLDAIYSQSTSTYLSTDVTAMVCMSCPVGAICNKTIKSLPNYWGYRDENDVVTMIRCHDDYCCSDLSTCT